VKGIDSFAENKVQTRKNLFSNILNLVANVCIGLFYTPYLVHNLGIAAYGVLPLVLIVNQYIGVITSSLTSSLTRFYTINLQQGKIEEASRCISTALAVIFILFAVLIIPIGSIIAYVDRIFTIPPELLAQTRLLFVLTISGFFLSLVSSIMNITLYANNRLDHLNLIKTIRMVLKLLFVVLLFSTFSKQIIYVGHANLLTEIIVLIFSFYFFFRFTSKDIKINLRKFDKPILISMLGMTTWVMIIQLGDTGIYRIDNLIINIFWSTTESGIVGAYSELGSYIMISLSVFSSLFGPLILMAYSRNKHDEVVRMAADRSFIVGVMAAVAAGLVIGFSSQISRVWLGEEFETYHLWLILKLVLIPYYTASGVFSFIYRAWNKVKIPALISIILGSINLIAAILVAKLLSPNYTAILIILGTGSLLGITQSYILNGWYVSKIYPEMKVPVIKNFISISIVLVSISLFSYLVNLVVCFSGIINLLITGFIVSLISILGVMRFILSKEQRRYLFDLVKWRKSV